jgi:putative flippase GtrA
MNLASIISDEKERVRFFRFAVVGAIGAVVDFSVFHLQVSLLRVPAVWAQGISFTTAVTSNFIWNRYWTYPDSRSKPIISQVISFFLVNLVGLGIRTPVFTLLEGPLRSLAERLPFLPISFLTPDFLGYSIALGVAVVVVMFWNFFVNRYWTYNDID